MLKVAIVTPKISHFEVPLFRLAASLDGLDVRVFHNDLRGDAFHDQDYGTTIDWGERLRAGYPNTGFLTVADLRRDLVNWQPDVALLYGFSWSGALPLVADLKSRRIPVLHRGTLSPLRDPRSTGILARLRRLARPFVLRRFDAHHFGGQYSEAVLRHAGIPQQERYFVPFSVDTNFFASEADAQRAIEDSQLIRRQLGWSADDPIVLIIGNQSWVKGADLFVEIAARLQQKNKGAKALVVGSGPMMKESRSACERRLLPRSYHFAGYVASKATVPYYLASTLVLFPSRYETWARAVNEAMLCRRPCVVNRNVAACGGLVEHDENGYVVDGLEPGPFADGIERFLSLPPDRRAAMGETARARAQYFSYETHADELRRSFVETAERASARLVRG